MLTSPILAPVALNAIGAGADVGIAAIALCARLISAIIWLTIFRTLFSAAFMPLVIAELKFPDAVAPAEEKAGANGLSALIMLFTKLFADDVAVEVMVDQKELCAVWVWLNGTVKICGNRFMELRFVLRN